uniref:HMA domain-containing protein n=1 Tax=Amphilophus citrinellus TaxID=61819 RepID=A0A3Q0T8L0_AMPCI
VPLSVRLCSTVQIRVDGMHCQSCVQSIEGQIGALKGVSHIQVSLQDKAAVVVFQPLVITQQELRDKIEDMGFDELNVSTETVTVWIGGMTCSSCVQTIEGRISQMTGVQFIVVSLKEEKGTITFDPSLTEPEQLRAAIEDMGFDASLQGREQKEMFSWCRDFYFILGLICLSWCKLGKIKLFMMQMCQTSYLIVKALK